MGTRYTFITEAVNSDIRAGDIQRLEEQLEIEEKIQGKAYFTFTKVVIGHLTYFHGINKNLGGGFYEWAQFNTNIRVVWIDDEGGNGSY